MHINFAPEYTHRSGRAQNFLTILKRWDMVGLKEGLPRVKTSTISSKSTESFLRNLIKMIEKSEFGNFFWKKINY